ncbi:hypothetical protein COP2_009623 [Malus domestica]
MHMRELDMRFRVREESWQVVIVPPGEWKLLLLPALFLLLFIIIMGCHLCIKEGHHLVDRRMAEIWNFKEQHMFCFLLACVAL